MQDLEHPTPQSDGYRMPGEYEVHEGCWMLWPERADTWRLGAVPAQQAFSDVAAAISQFEPVTMGVSGKHYENARHMLPKRVRVVEISSDDAWMRDVGPTFVKNDQGEVRGVDWRFNAWGGLKHGAYFPWYQDALVARKVMELERVEAYRAPLILEGGSIHVDGEGTLVTTEECLLNPNRNPELSKGEIEALLRAYLGIEQIIWLPRGVYKDETNGHVDNLCCFTAPGEILVTWTEDRSDPQYEISREAFEILSQTEDAGGRRLKVHKIHQPGPLFRTEEESRGVGYGEYAATRRSGQRLAGSYVNFYIANGGIVMPLLDEAHDREAMAVIQSLFPDRKVVGVESREVLLGGGNIHCITQQQPTGLDKS